MKLDQQIAKNGKLKKLITFVLLCEIKIKKVELPACDYIKINVL